MERAPRDWRRIGHTLARIHGVKGDQFGLETHSYFGPLYQDNRPMSTWAAFYAERRLWPRLIGAIDSGHLSTAAIRQIEKLISRLPDLCGPETAPCLLHGDAQQNNFISTEAGVVVIDPAVYFGHPEMDLAAIDMFQPARQDVFTQQGQTDEHGNPSGKPYVAIDSVDAGIGDLVRVIEQAVNAEVEAARPVKVQILPREVAFQIPDLIRTKINLLPAMISEIRTIEIEGLDLQADGGTHVRNTREVGRMRIVDYKSKGKINKRIYVELDGD